MGQPSGEAPIAPSRRPNGALTAPVHAVFSVVEQAGAGLPAPRLARGRARRTARRGQRAEAARSARDPAPASRRGRFDRTAHHRALGREPSADRGDVVAEHDLSAAKGARGRIGRHARPWLRTGRRQAADRRPPLRGPDRELAWDRTARALATSAGSPPALAGPASRRIHLRLLRAR